MANVVPLAVSGQVLPTQESMLMAIVDSTPYYLVSDINGTPYFQPLYQDVTTGLAVFSNSATRLTVALGPRNSNQTTVVITGHSGAFLVDKTILRIVAPGSIASASSLIPIEKLSYADPSLVACGYQYVIDTLTGGPGIPRFYITNNWSATPNAQAIGSLAQLPAVNSFYVFPISGLVDSSGKPASADVFTTIYNDVLGKTAETFLFSSRDAWLAGAGEPYYFCADSSCGPLCLGTCNGQYQECQRLKNSNFACIVTVSARCKILAMLPFLIPAVISMIVFFAVFLQSKYRQHHAVTGMPIPGAPRVYRFNTRVKIFLVANLLFSGILVLVMLLMTVIHTDAVSLYLRRVCRLTGEYQ